MADAISSGHAFRDLIGRHLALEDAIDVAGRAAELIHKTRSMGEQAAAGDEEAFEVDRG
jgi:hypothetical protein